MTDIELLCSSGAFIGRKNGRDHTLFLDISDTLHADGFEFMMYESWYDKIETIISDFKNHALYTPVLHADKMIGHSIAQGDVNFALQCFEKNCKIANALGAKKLVLHLWNGPSSDDFIEKNISSVGELYSIADAYGVMLCCENVVCKNGDPLDYLYRICEKCDNATFTYDTKMSAFHGTQDKVLSIEYSWLWERVRHLHINDYGGAVKDWSSLATLHIGQGKIDFTHFFEYMKKINYRGTLTLECTSMGENCALYPEKMNESIKKARQYLAI